jgi:Co/Zn/Cd efflux system component
MSDCGYHSAQAKTSAERHALGIALDLNASRFVKGTAGWFAGSSALLANALDMLADAVGYGDDLEVLLRAGQQIATWPKRFPGHET